MSPLPSGVLSCVMRPLMRARGALVPEVGVDAVREVDRRRARRHHAHVAARREDEDLVAEHVRLDGLEEVLGAGGLLLPLDEVAQPGHALLVLAVGAAGILLVAPVRGDAVLGDLVHLVGADLHLERPRARPHDAGVQRLVHRLLRVRDVVVERAGDGPPCLMHHAQRVVAVARIVNEHAQRDEVVDLVERLTLGGVALHLLVRRVEVLDAPRHVRLDARLVQRLAQLALDAPHEALALRAPRRDRRRGPPVLLRLQHAEREVLELPLHLPDAEPPGERRVDVHRLACDLVLAVRFQVLDRPHVVEPVGDLDDHDAHVLGHRQQHLAHGLGVDRALAAGRGRRGDVVDLRPRPRRGSRRRRRSGSRAGRG